MANEREDLKDVKSVQERVKELEQLGVRNQKEQELYEILKTRYELFQRIIQITDQENQSLNDSIARTKALLDLETDQEVKRQHLRELREQEFELAKKELLNYRLTGENDEKRLKELQERFDKTKKVLELMDEEVKKQEELNDLEKKRGDLLNNIKEKISTITGGISDQIGQMFSMTGILGTVGSMFKEVMQTNQDLVKTTGQVNLLTRDFGKSVGIGFEAYGVGYKEMGDAFGTLYTGMSGFSNVSKEVQDSLAANTAKMENLGISGQTTAANFNTLTKSLKMSAGEVVGVNDKLAKAAIGAGIAPKKMADDFGPAMSSLASHGQKGIDVFISLQKQSKMLGMEFTTLQGIVGESFDTFEGAAEKAGKLNAILGGDYLNSVEMLNATESERVEILRRSFEASGKNFESMDRFEKMSIQRALGVNSVAEAAKLLGAVSLEDRLAMEKEAAAQEKLEEAQKKSADSSRQLQLIFSDLLIVIAPLAEMVKNLIIWFAEHKYITLTVVAIVLLLKAMAGFNQIADTVKTFFSFFKTGVSQAGAGAAEAGKDIGEGVAEAGKGVAEGSKGVAEGIKNVGKGVGEGGAAAEPAIPVFLAIGGAIALIGVGIGAAAFGISYLADSFAKLNGEQLIAFTIALGIFMAGFVAMTIVLAGLATTGVGEIAALVLLGIGAGIALIGAGIMMASIGMSMLVESIMSLAMGDAGASVSGIFFQIALGVGALVVSLMGLMAIGLNPIGWIALSAGIGVFALAIKGLAAAIDQLPEDAKFQAKVETLKVVNETIKTANEAGPNIEPSINFINAAKEYHKAQKESKSADNDALVQALKTAITKPAEKESGGKQPVILRIENGPDLVGYVWNQRSVSFDGQ